MNPRLTSCNHGSRNLSCVLTCFGCVAFIISLLYAHGKEYKKELVFECINISTLTLSVICLYSTHLCIALYVLSNTSFVVQVYHSVVCDSRA